MAQGRSLAEIVTAPIAIERTGPVSTVDLDVRMGKLFLTASANGEAREFIFDTGSPSMVSRELADALELEIVASNTGVDANGNPVTMDIAILETLAVGSTVFHDVPVMVFDFSVLSIGACLIDGGILGSEILPGSAWRIDAENESLSFAETYAALGGGVPEVRASLHDFGYPHAPIIDYQLGDVSDRALFDTGNSEAVMLFRPVADDDSVQALMSPGSRRTGRGSEGESAGGLGETTELFRFTLNEFYIDGQMIAPVRAAQRGAPPSLIGAGILDTHHVVLDFPNEEFLLERRQQAAPVEVEAGYSLGFVGGFATVVQIFNGSAADAAGLRLGDRIESIDDHSLLVTPQAPLCDTVTWLTQSFRPAQGGDMTVRRDGEVLTIAVPASDG